MWANLIYSPSKTVRCHKQGPGNTENMEPQLRKIGVPRAGEMAQGLRGPGFNFQHPHNGSQLSVSPVPGDSTPSLIFKDIAYTPRDTQTYPQTKQPYT